MLLIERGRGAAVGSWSIPGGRVEPGEAVAAAVERELAEETGLAGRCGRFVGWVERISAEHHFVILDFEVAVPADVSPVAGDDATAVRWVALDELADHPGLVPGLVEFLAERGLVRPVSDPSTAEGASPRTP